MTGVFVFGVLAGIVLSLWKSRINYLALDSLPLAPTVDALDVTVVIPARNEAHQIARCVRSFAGTRVLVVDDASADGTAAVARQAGAEVMPAPLLAADAKGKPNACAAGARAISSKWILFVDADTWFEPGFTASLIRYAEVQQAQMVTAFLEQRCETLVEKALLPYAFALYFTGVSARCVNDSLSAEALANGQCLLFERTAYEGIGGHGSVTGSVIEDVALAQRAKQHRLRVRVIRAETLAHVRMYDSFGAIWRGFQKNSFRFLLINPWSGIQVIVASILLTSWLPVLVLAYRDRWAALILLVAPFVLLAPWYVQGKLRNAWQALLAPVGIYLFQLIALNGMVSTVFRRRTIWKQRRV